MVKRKLTKWKTVLSQNLTESYVDSAMRILEGISLEPIAETVTLQDLQKEEAEGSIYRRRRNK